MTKISYENCINYIVSEKQKGVGSRAIAKALGGCSKSTVNYYYNKWLESHQSHTPVCFMVGIQFMLLVKNTSTTTLSNC